VYVLAVTLAIRVPAVIVAARLDGMTGAMMALTASAFLNMFIWNGAVPAILKLRFADILQVTWRSILAGIVMMAAVYLMMKSWPASDLALLRFVAIALAGGVVLLAVQFSLWMIS